MSCGVSVERKLEVLAAAARAMSLQHEMALRKRKPSLISRLTKPWDIAVNVESGAISWKDVGQPDPQAGWSFKDRMSEAVETFILGISAHFDQDLEKAVETVCDNYDHKPVLLNVWEKMGTGETERTLRLAGTIGYEKKRSKQWRRISAALKAWKERWQSFDTPDGEATSIEVPRLGASQEKTHGFGNRRRV
jgi:hypothetical protein